MRRLLLCLVVPALAACGSSGSSATSSSAPGQAAPATITIQNFAFSPNPVKAKVGDTITVTNKDGTSHSVTADDNSFDTKPFASGSRTITVTKAGTIKFHCSIHSTMTGEIDVT